MSLFWPFSFVMATITETLNLSFFLYLVKLSHYVMVLKIFFQPFFQLFQPEFIRSITKKCYGYVMLMLWYVPFFECWQAIDLSRHNINFQLAFSMLSFNILYIRQGCAAVPVPVLACFILHSQNKDKISNFSPSQPGGDPFLFPKNLNTAVLPATPEASQC